MKHGDILHFKAKGWYRLKAGLNPMRTAIFLEIFGENVVAIFEQGEVKLIQLFDFTKRFDYVSSRPNWISDPANEILQRLGLKYKNENVFFAEIIGISDFDKVKKGGILQICIEKGWLLAE